MKLRYLELVLFVIFAAGVYYVSENWNKEIECEPQLFSHATVQINDKNYSFRVADNACKMQQGIKGRMSFEESQGILFMFQKEQYRTFRMNGVLIPLSIAFISENNTIVDIQSMHTENESTYYFMLEKYKSQFPAKYVIEVPQGFFGNEGIKLGDRIQLR